ncbi:PBS lyase [Streptomyces sp. Je 1-79]|uniref:HEAT repeat domain-containing protein n=1 Tax=Streptomyces sp. Je 1-79 TaxID=2943847 RepID=UPI0021A54B4D|nr:PBS lyase [Streptomyces sp. Je 1-79]MCT4354433.1 PBS lyase [Streptomyces sp. Je 1-79]
MLTGIEEVDWASLGHAYGPADDVPGMLRGLASHDPAERELALDGMYGAVHHQGDVYDSTLACIPFLLELVADPEVQDRGGIVELLTSVGGIDLSGEDELDELDPEDEDFIPAANYAMAAAAVAAGADVFLGLVGDPDAEVRLAAPCALASLHPDPARVLTLLRERLTVERDTEVRLALVEAVGRIARRHESLRDETVDWLGWLTRAAQAPGLRLAALAQLARCAPGEVPDDVVERVTRLLDEVRTAPPEPAAPENSRPSTPTLAGQVRDLFEERSTGRPTPWTDELMRTLHTALDDRVEDRIALILAQLRSPDRCQRADAIWLCGGLIRVWRGGYEEVVRLIGTQLADPEPRLREAATSFLEGLFELTGPAADALAARLATRPGRPERPEWAERPEGTPGAPDARARALLALARSGDARAVPMLARALVEPDVRRDLLYAVPTLGPAAAPLAPLLRRRLARVELDDRLYEHAAPLLFALASVRGVQALPEVLRVLRGAPSNRRDWVQEAALRALAAFGPAARAAVPDARALLNSEAAAVSAQAALTLWSVEGDRDAVLPTLAAWLGPDATAPDRCAAARALGAIGPAAKSSAPALLPGLAARDLWVRVRSAAALWRVSGDASSALPVLLTAWEENRHARVDIAECLAEMGPEAVEARWVIDRELSRRRRHNVRESGYSTHDIHEDEKLLTFCRAAIDRMER